MRLVVLMLCCAPLFAQTVPASFQLDGKADEWLGLPPTLTLKSVQAGREGQVWTRLTADGLIVAGRVGGGAPKFATTQEEMAQRDHIEVWLAPMNAPKLPPIGWGNQFGPVEDKTEKSCPELASDAKAIADCRRWFQAQPAYRTQFRRLFVRQWQLAPNIAVESFAQPAYAQLQSRMGKNMGDLIAPLRPSGTPKALFQALSQGYDFEMLVPWAAFPPLNELKANELRLMVDALSAHDGPARSQPYSTTSANRKWGEAETFTALQLRPSRTFRITHCGYPLTANNIYREPQPAWFRPDTSGEIKSVFVLQNFTVGYAYAPDGWSPIVRTTDYYEQPLGEGETLCGPSIRYHSAAADREFKADLEKDGFGVKPLPDGSRLLKFGPRIFYSEFGSGQCGACPRVQLTLAILTKDLRWIEAYQYFSAVEEPEEFDLEVSPDWKKVTVYEKGEAQGYCLTGTTYSECGKRQKAKPPAKKSLKTDPPA